MNSKCSPLLAHSPSPRAPSLRLCLQRVQRVLTEREFPLKTHKRLLRKQTLTDEDPRIDKRNKNGADVR